MSTITPESTMPTEMPEGLEEYPAFGTAVLDYDQQFKDYLDQLDGLSENELPEGYVRSDAPSIPEKGAASPDLAVAVLLKRLGAPVAIVSIEDDEFGPNFFVGFDPEIEQAYKRLWDEIFGEDGRRLANGIARAGISAQDALPTTFHVAPIVNRDILWAYKQGILERAYLTSKISQYMDRGADMDTLGSVGMEAELAESLIAKKDVRPLALETVLAMGSIDALNALNNDHKLAEELHIDLESLPTVDDSKLGFAEGEFMKAYDSYWKPVFDSMRRD